MATDTLPSGETMSRKSKSAWMTEQEVADTETSLNAACKWKPQVYEGSLWPCGAIDRLHTHACMNTALAICWLSYSKKCRCSLLTRAYAW